MVGQEVGIYGAFIGITNEPCITLPSSLHILNTLGHFNFVLLLFLHKTIPLRIKMVIVIFPFKTSYHDIGKESTSPFR